MSGFFQELQIHAKHASLFWLAVFSVRYLERRGLLVRDTGNCYPTSETMGASDEDPSNHLLGSSISYRIAVGPQKGPKAVTT